jgi:ribonucleotide monophosphatase NagD (HAD superfamily)
MSEIVEPKDSVKEDATKAERQRLTVLLLSNAARMSSDYKNTIKHTGGLLTSSMVFAYSKALNDAIKLITKDNE